MKQLSFIVILLLIVISSSSMISSVSVHQYSIVDNYVSLNSPIINKQNTMVMISGTYGEKGMFWRWWPPGFDEKTEADILTTIIYEWANNIISEFNGNPYNYGDARHTYNWITNHPSNTPTQLRAYVINLLTSSKTIVGFIGHTVKDYEEKPIIVYEWDPDKHNYNPTNWLLPDNNNWVYPYKYQETIFPIAVRNRIINKPISLLPKMAVIIACQSAVKQDDKYGWSWAYRISEEDPYTYWMNRAFVGFTTKISVDMFSRYIKAADLVKRMIYYMNQGYWSDDAFKQAAEDLDYDYVIRYFKGPNTPIPSDREQAMYIGRWFKLDPSDEERALDKIYSFTRQYTPFIHSIIAGRKPDKIYEEQYLAGKRMRFIWEDIPVRIHGTNLSISIYVHVYVDDYVVSILSIDARIGLPVKYYNLENELKSLYSRIFEENINTSEDWIRYIDLNKTLWEWNINYTRLVSNGEINTLFKEDFKELVEYTRILNKTLATYGYVLVPYRYSGVKSNGYSKYYLVIDPKRNSTLSIFDPSIEYYHSRRISLSYDDKGGSGLSYHDLVSLILDLGILKNLTIVDIGDREAYRLARANLGDSAVLREKRIIIYLDEKKAETQYIFIKDEDNRMLLFILYGDGSAESYELYKKSLSWSRDTDPWVLVSSSIIIAITVVILYRIVVSKTRRK